MAFVFDHFGDFKRQLPDRDPEETGDWIGALDSIVETEGRARAQFILYKILKRARQQHLGLPPLTATRYINTISPEQEPEFPGDEQVERRIRRMIRWNAVAMVLRANNRAPGIGGHLATYASAASLYEVGFNHFFRGKDAPGMGDQVFFQGHAAPGIYARAFLDGRLTEDHLDHFRQEVGGRGLSSYPHPRLMPDFWEFPTVSMGLGPLAAVYQARFNRYLHHRGIKDTSNSRVWAFLGDGETDEPEAMGSISIAAREGLDNLTFVVNCNLQRLDGPVRGDGKIIQELEAVFRGAGWNVIKVIWGREFDELLAHDVDGVLVDRMNETLDGEFQKYSVESGAYIREHFHRLGLDADRRTRAAELVGGGAHPPVADQHIHRKKVGISSGRSRAGKRMLGAGCLSGNRINKGAQMKPLMLGIALAAAGSFLLPSAAAAEQKFVVKPVAQKKVKQLPAGPLYWRIENFATLAQAQAAADAKHWNPDTVSYDANTSLAAEVDGKAWLFTLGPKGGASDGGTRVAEIGPVPHITAREYLLRINSTGGPPGVKTPVHVHPGSETFYVLSGRLGQKILGGVSYVEAGQSMLGHVANTPMEVFSGGKGDLHALVMFVVDADQPFSTRAKMTSH